MTQTELTEEDLDTLDIVAKNEPVRSRTIAENTYWADSSKDVNYRLQKLEEYGLVEREEIEDSQYPVNPKQAWITEDGHEILATLDDSQPRTLEERVERMEKQVGRMRETYGQVKQRIVALEERLEELEDDVDKDFTEVANELTRINNTLEDEPFASDFDAEDFTFGD